MERRQDLSAERSAQRPAEDPVLSMRGIGKHLWAGETSDRFLERMRSEDAPPPPPIDQPRVNVNDLIWQRIESCQGQTFYTARGLPFTFRIEGPGIWFFRDGRRINRKLARVQVEIAISRCPLASTTEIKDLMDYAYLYSVLMDRRIRGQSW